MLASSNRISGNGYLATRQITKDAVRNYNYDTAGRSTVITKGITSIYNTYDALGQRIAKKTASTSLYFMYDENGNLLGEYDQNRAMVREYIWLNGRIVGMLSKDLPNTLLRVHTDHLGTPRAVSSGNGTTRKVLWRWDGDAFGDVLPTNPTTTKLDVPIRMAGQYFDSEVGTFYNYFRDYDPAMGRYVESDPIGLQGGMNTFGYVGGQVLMYIDPLGLLPGSGGRGSRGMQGVADAIDHGICNWFPYGAECRGFVCVKYKCIIKECDKDREYFIDLQSSTVSSPSYKISQDRNCKCIKECAKDKFMCKGGSTR